MRPEMDVITSSSSLREFNLVCPMVMQAESLAFRLRRGFLSKHEAIEVGMGWMDDRGRFLARRRRRALRFSNASSSSSSFLRSFVPRIVIISGLTANPTGDRRGIMQRRVMLQTLEEPPSFFALLLHYG